MPRAGRARSLQSTSCWSRTRRWFSMRRPTTPGCLGAYPNGFALDATHHPHITMLQQFVRTADLCKVYTAANRILANERGDRLEPEGVQALLHSSPAKRHCGYCRRADGRASTPAATGAILDAVAPFTERTGTAAAFVSCGTTRSRHPTRIDRLRHQFHYGRIRQEVQILMSRSVSLQKPILTRCSRNPFQTFTFSPVGGVILRQLGRGFGGGLARSFQALSLAPLRPGRYRGHERSSIRSRRVTAR